MISRPAIGFLMGIGLWTFLVPIVTTDAPVRGRSEWSPVDFVVARADQWKPAPPLLHMHLVLYQIAFLYALMVVAILVLALRRPSKPLKLIAVIGSATSVSLFGTGGARSFGWLFFGRRTYSRILDGDTSWRGQLLGWHGFHFASAYVILLLVMPLLALAVFTSEPDAMRLGRSEQSQ
jgi:hypothetical protein